MELGIMELLAILATSAVGGGAGGGGTVKLVLNGLQKDVRDIRHEVREVHQETSSTKERVIVLEARNELRRAEDR